MPYLFDHAWKAERERLASIEERLDPFTIQCCDLIGVTGGWRCLEVGAGGGSIAEWLCDRVGLDGCVVATDLETKFIEAIDKPNLEVRRHDIRSETLEHESFDFVHARKVLEHFADPLPAIRMMISALRHGGWILLEDADMLYLAWNNSSDPEFFRRAYTAFVGSLESAGFRPRLGLELGRILRSENLTSVQVLGTSAEWSAAEPAGRLFALTFQKIRGRVVDQGLLEPAEADRFLEEIQTPSFRAITAVHFGAWGQKTSQ